MSGNTTPAKIGYHILILHILAIKIKVECSSEMPATLPAAGLTLTMNHCKGLKSVTVTNETKNKLFCCLEQVCSGKS
jgi:hypothetical protein